MNILLDRNVLLRIVRADHPQHAAAVRSVDILLSGGHELRLVPQVLYEFWVVATRPESDNGLGHATAVVHQQVNSFRRMFKLLEDRDGQPDVWLKLVVNHDCKGKSAHDARLVAAMLSHDVAHSLTFNVSHFDRFKQITVLGPESDTE